MILTIIQNQKQKKMLKGLGQTKDTNERPASVNKPARLVVCCGFQSAVSLSHITWRLRGNLSQSGEDHLWLRRNLSGGGEDHLFTLAGFSFVSFV